MPFWKPILLAFGCREGVWVGSGVSEVQAAFVTTVATVYGSRHLQLFISKRDSVSPFSDPTSRNPSNLRAADSSSRKSPYANSQSESQNLIWSVSLSSFPMRRQWRRESCLQLWRLTLRESQEQQAQAFVPLRACPDRCSSSCTAKVQIRLKPQRHHRVTVR